MFIVQCVWTFLGSVDVRLQFVVDLEAASQAIGFSQIKTLFA